MVMLNFKRFLEADIGHSQALDNELGIDRSSYVNMTIPFSGVLNGKTYNLVPMLVKGFEPDAANAHTAVLEINSQNDPALHQKVAFNHGGKFVKTTSDSGIIRVPIAKFDSMLGQGWSPLVQQQSGDMGGLDAGSIPGMPPM